VSEETSSVCTVLLLVGPIESTTNAATYSIDRRGCIDQSVGGGGVQVQWNTGTCAAIHFL
jgi:hypothetical protein